MRKNRLVAPVVKWVGGKRQLLDDLTPLFPKRVTSYCIARKISRFRNRIIWWIQIDKSSFCYIGKHFGIINTAKSQLCFLKVSTNSF